MNRRGQDVLAIAAMLASYGAAREFKIDPADLASIAGPGRGGLVVPFARAGRDAVSMAALDAWARRRRRARQTHPGKRGRP